MEENRPLATGDEKERDDDKPVVREQCDGAQHEQGRSGPNLFEEYIVSVFRVQLLRWHNRSGWGSGCLGVRKYVRVRGGEGWEPDKEKEVTRGRTGREGVGRNNMTCTYRSLAGPLVESVESLTMNGFRRIERREPTVVMISYDCDYSFGYGIEWPRGDGHYPNRCIIDLFFRAYERSGGDGRWVSEVIMTRGRVETDSHSCKSREEGPFTIEIELRGGAEDKPWWRWRWRTAMGRDEKNAPALEA